MSHDACRDSLSEFLDQTLAPDQRELVAAHLESCADCARIAGELGEIRATLRGAAPVAAPPELRQNVRAALRLEQESRAARPQFAWRWPRRWPQRTSQLAWSGTLAVAAIGLMVLARPFNDAPFSSPDDTSASLSDSSPAPSTARNAPAGGSASPSAPRKLSKPAVGRPKTPKPAPLPANATASGAPPRSEIPSATPTAANSAITDSAATDSAARGAMPPQQPPSATPENKEPASAPMPRSSGPQRARTGDSDGAAPPVAPRQNRSSASPPAAILNQKPAPPLPSMSRPNAAPDTAASRDSDAFRTSNASPESEAAPAASSLEDASPRARINTPSAPPQSALPALPRASSGPLFALQLRAEPAPEAPPVALPSQNQAPIQSPADSSSGAASPQLAPTGPESPKAFSPPNRNSNGRSDGVLRRAAPGSTQEPASGPRAPMLKPRSSRPSAARGAGNPIDDSRSNGFSSAPPTNSNRASRFTLQIGTARPVSNARIRLEIPASLRLLWPASTVVWSGELSAQNPVKIAFSLGAVRGGEKILVRVEQKSAGAPSKTLETRVLTLPPPL